MHRFVVDNAIRGPGEMVVLSREESQHAARALRLRPGEKVQLLDGAALYDATLTDVSDKETAARVDGLLPSPEPEVHVTLLQGLPKADKMEWIVQKATELGAWELWPTETSRSVAKADKGSGKRERWGRIALEAAKQSGRAHVPQVCETTPFSAALGAIAQAEPPFDLILVPWEEERALPMSQAVRAYGDAHGAPRRVLIFIGPEGGISQEEMDAMTALGGVGVTLGRRILRTETAGLCALSVLWAALGEM